MIPLSFGWLAVIAVEGFVSFTKDNVSLSGKRENLFSNRNDWNVFKDSTFIYTVIFVVCPSVNIRCTVFLLCHTILKDELNIKDVWVLMGNTVLGRTGRNGIYVSKSLYYVT